MFGDGKQTTHPEEAQKFTAEVMQNKDAASARFAAGMKALKDNPHTDPNHIAAIGYCFGGSVVLSMALQVARPGGDTLFTEKLLIEPQRHAMRQTGVMGAFDVFGNVLVCTPKETAERIWQRTSAGVDLASGLAFGACRLPNDAGLIFKVLGRETAPVKDKVREFWRIVREEVTGSRLPPPFLWR